MLLPWASGFFSLRTAFELHGGYAPRDPKEAEQFGIKVVVVDISAASTQRD
jgi:hypothetical protein